MAIQAVAMPRDLVEAVHAALDRHASLAIERLRWSRGQFKGSSVLAAPGNHASYRRLVGSKYLSNGRAKGEGNRRSGNKYLAWAFIEAANMAIRYEPRAKVYYERKKAKSKPVVARKAVAHKLARACFYVMRDEVPFEPERCFG